MTKIIMNEENLLDDNSQVEDDIAIEPEKDSEIASLQVGFLEPRILLSATWVEVDTDDSVDDASASDD